MTLVVIDEHRSIEFHVIGETKESTTMISTLQPNVTTVRDNSTLLILTVTKGFNVSHLM